jgi:hypothetical protein
MEYASFLLVGWPDAPLPLLFRFCVNDTYYCTTDATE